MLTIGCSGDWLEERPNRSLVVPSELKDLQALLDNTLAMNGATLGGGVYPSIGEAASDAYYLADNVWQSLSRAEDKNAYIWNEVIFEGNTSTNWNKMYITVFYANTVLDDLMDREVEISNRPEYDNILGSALFYRSYAFFHLAQIFTVPYDASTAERELGIPLKSGSDFNEPIFRPTLKENYDRILTDLGQAYDLLPETPLYKTRPSKPAVDAFFARVYLVMGDFEMALYHAERCLGANGNLMDFNGLDVGATLPFLRFNDEVLFESSLTNSTALSNHIIDGSLYESYDGHDLRKAAYYRVLTGNLRFKGSYSRSASVFFCGLAVDEMYLIAAECSARLGNLGQANEHLQDLMATRYRRIDGLGTYPPTGHLNGEDLLGLILAERRKELIFRGLRWMDLRRLNREGANIVLTRSVAGNPYSLQPNSTRYTFPIPDDVIAATGIGQNNR